MRHVILLLVLTVTAEAYDKRLDAEMITHAGQSQFSQYLQKMRDYAITHHSLFPPLIASIYGVDSSQHELGAELPPEDSSSEDIPFWTFRGSTVMTEDYIRLTPDTETTFGSLFNVVPLQLPSFELMFGFKVHGSGRAGAYGLAMWIVDRIPQLAGDLFGHPRHFRGLGIALDTYDNTSSQANPYLSLVYKHYDGRDDTKEYYPRVDLVEYSPTGCHLKYRNSESLMAVAVRYNRRTTIDVVYTTDAFASESTCFSVDTADFPLAIGKQDHRFYIGFTAQTGNITDNHDIHAVGVYPLRHTHSHPDETEEPVGETLHLFDLQQDRQERERLQNTGEKFH